jgi:glycosyltransferase involved in cell wall biosynthesis
MTAAHHVLINGLSIGSGGGYTVGRELLRHLALEKPDWTFTIATTSKHKLHEEMERESLPQNCRIFRTPAETSGRVARMRYERNDLVEWARKNNVTRLLQLNGMVIPTMRIPTLSHNQDPWPYRPQAYVSWKEHITAALKRREHKRALVVAERMGFTSMYLRDLVIDRFGIQPKRAAVFYNGLSEDWLARTREPLPDWESRPMELLSVSNVLPYKRQCLVVRALPALIRKPGLSDLVYRVVGQGDPEFLKQISDLAKALGVERHVIVHGRLSDGETQQYYRQARAFVLMSVCESFGIPALEAMTFGTPVVTSDCCAMPEICGDAAILSPVDDVDSLVENLHLALTNGTRVQQLRESGVARVARFRWDETAESMAKAMEEMEHAI